MIFCLGLLLFSIPFVYMFADLGDARHVRHRIYTAVDAASLAGAMQYEQKVLSYTSYGSPDQWIYVVDEPRAEVHAEATLLANLQDLIDQGLVLETYSITFPDEFHVRTEATMTYNATRTGRALERFLDAPPQDFSAQITVHAVAKVGNP